MFFSITEKLFNGKGQCLLQFVCVNIEDVAWWFWGQKIVEVIFVCSKKSARVNRRHAYSYHSLHKFQMYTIRQEFQVGLQTFRKASPETLLALN